MKQQGNHSDIIIAGGGLAGLSLAWHIEHSFPGRFSIVIIEKEAKRSNDRTWCFWEKGQGPFEDAVVKSWDHLAVKGPGWEKILDIEPYKYKMIRSAALYRMIREFLENKTNIFWVQESIEELKGQKAGAVVKTESAEYSADWVFNSAIRKKVPEGYPRFLLQHFKGYFLKTKEAAFNPDIPLFMDFRIEQGKDVRFVYVLPFNEEEALVEYTIFSPSLWEKASYDTALKDYLRDIQGINEYEIMEEEFGVIPMTDFRFPDFHDTNILNIGTAGGMTKASTGYTFVNTIRQCEGIVRSIQSAGHPFDLNWKNHPRFRFYDGILLDVLSKNRFPGREIFRYMFGKNKESLVFDFLGEDSRFHQELGLFLSFPQLPFIKGFLSVLKDKLR